MGLKKGQTNSGSFKKGNISWMEGKHHNEETKEKIRNSNYHKNLKDESNPFYGKHHTEETINKISTTKTGIKNIKESETKKRLFAEGKLVSWQKGKKGVSNHLSLISIQRRGKTIEEIYGKEKAKEIRDKISGVNASHWRGGKSFEPYDFNFNKIIKNKIRDRDNQVCMNCGIHREQLKEALHIHHINYDKLCSVEQNFISLCKNCHSLTQVNRPYWQKLFQEKLSKLYNYQYSEDGKIILNLNAHTLNGVN